MRRRRDNTVDNLPEVLRAIVRRMLTGEDGRHSYREIIETVSEKTDGKVILTRSLLSRYFHSTMEAEIETAERRARFSVNLAEAIAKSANATTDGEREAVILNVIDGALLTLEQDPSTADPAKLFDARAKNVRADVARKQQALDERKFDGEMKDLKSSLAAAKDEIKALKGASNGKAAGPSPAETYLAAARDVLGILATYGELTPILQKYDGNIAKRLATESERRGKEPAHA